MGTKNIFLGVLLFVVFFSFAVLAGARAFTLEEAVREAGAKSLVLKQAEERVRTAETGAAEQRTYLLPSFNLSGEILTRKEISSMVQRLPARRRLMSTIFLWRLLSPYLPEAASWASTRLPDWQLILPAPPTMLFTWT